MNEIDPSIRAVLAVVALWLITKIGNALFDVLRKRVVETPEKAEADRMTAILETLNRIDKTTQKLETESAVDREKVSNLAGQLVHVGNRLQGISDDYSKRIGALEEQSVRHDERWNMANVLRQVLREEKDQ
jgi:aminoglycoside phosphotransferase (APT) family kinase protein